MTFFVEKNSMINLKEKRKTDHKKTYLGKMIVFCEGKTEYNYFNYFKLKLEKKKSKYTSFELELIDVEGGGANSIFDKTIAFLEAPKNSKYQLFEKVIVFDLDEPKAKVRMKEVLINISRSDYNFVPLCSYKTFEVWLLMHLVDVYESLSKSKLKEKIRLNLNLQRYVKNSKGIIAKILHDDANVKKAVLNGRKLDETYLGEGKKIISDYKDMNPYTSVFKLVEDILEELE